MKDADDATPPSYGLNSKLTKRNGEMVELVWKEDGLYGEATKAKLTTLYNAKIKAESAPKPSSKPSIASSSKVASAQSFNKSIAGTYKVKASNGLNLRYKPGDTSNSNLIITIPNGKSVVNYGYYTTVNGVKWYLVTYKDTPGFVSSRYLVK